MVTSAQVASHAGLSRSTVSQVLNGHTHLFAPETISRVQESAAALGYRPSVAGRTLARGTSDIVITLIPDVTFNPRLRELVDVVTAGLADAGFTNLLQFVGSQTMLEDTILGIKPFGVLSLAPLAEEQRQRLLDQGVHLVVQSSRMQAAIDEAIGRLQAAHLADAGYEVLGIVLPTSDRESRFARPREAGVRSFATERGLEVIPTLHIRLDSGGAASVVKTLPRSSVGIAAYNDEVALAVLGASLWQGRLVPAELGIIGIDNSSIARAATPSLTTVDYDIAFSGHAIVESILRGSNDLDSDVSAAHQVEERLRVIQGDTTRTPR